MMQGKCCGSKKLCPLSFGLAFGLTAGLAAMIWGFWLMYSPNIHPSMMPVSFMDVLGHAGAAAIKAFFFGFVLSLLYDCIACCLSKCKSSGQGCGCGCSSSGGKAQ